MAAAAKKLRKPAPTHGDLIDGLGGPVKVRDMIAEAFGRDITTHAVSMMKTRGVSQKYRPFLASRAKTAGVALPDGFLGPAV